ncbi:hypothetical protein EVU94_13985 [Flavobacteriaceae bacterium 144Ye]|nr:hypothetical protein EVU94_13985 [Flavobacteriaceae bacterium 144Ye]
MSVVGYTIFGRPVQHEYVSNGLFNELNLNSESYLSDRIALQKGQNLIILKRYKDKNGFEVTTVFVNTYAVSYNDRAGGFVGAGIAFIGQPSVKLIYNRLKQLHQQSLSLIDSETFKFKATKIDASELSLPSLSEEGLFINRTPRKQRAKDNNTIGVKIIGNFYESLMGTIQGFVFNDSYYGVKTAYVSNQDDLLLSLVPQNSINHLHNLLDYSNALKKYKAFIANERKKLKEESDKVKKQIEDSKQRNLNELNKERHTIQEIKNRLDVRERSVRELERNKERLEIKIKDYEFTEERLISKVNKLNSTKKKAEDEINEIKAIKQNSFNHFIQKPVFREDVDIFKDQIIQEYELENKKSRKDWFKVILLFSTLLFFISTAYLGYLLYDKNNNLIESENEKSALETNLKNTESEVVLLESNEYLSHLPEETSVNSFFKFETEEKKSRKEKLKEAINIAAGNKMASDVLREKILEKLEARTWNFREILYENDPNKIMGGLSVLDTLKNHCFKNKIDLFSSPLFLINDLEGKELIKKEMTVTSESGDEELLKQYLKIKNNVYKKLKIDYNEPKKGETFQDSDPILLMHFRWMVFNYKDQKDFYKKKKGEKVLVPVLK